ncbi:probable serine/threonine-protein kinase DDB_G0280133 [Musca vetustissima]|uniref:probable serine/threonine-protein kinase DDB_G0280133 n=1 Tax=Musca vetustissima TaxID=27455 RepID=UPI002AB7DBD9|nr:probable serine/threonine-protein kinase DDB_G0280133 [Musca vetustissima]
MLSIQQLIKALRKLQNSTAINNTAAGDLVKSIKHVASTAAETATRAPSSTVLMTSLLNRREQHHEDELDAEVGRKTTSSLPKQQGEEQTNVYMGSHVGRSSSGDNNNANTTSNSSSSSTDTSKNGNNHQQQQTLNCHNECFSLYSSLDTDGSIKATESENFTTQDPQTVVILSTTSSPHSVATTQQRGPQHNHHHTHHHSLNHQQNQLRSQRIQNFFQQQIFHQQFHTQQHYHNLNTKHKQTQFAMSSLAAEPLVAAATTSSATTLQKDDLNSNCKVCGGGGHQASDDESSSSSSKSNPQQSSASDEI